MVPLDTTVTTTEVRYVSTRQLTGLPRVAHSRWRVMTRYKDNDHLPPVCYSASSLLLLSELVPLLLPVRWCHRCRRYRWYWCRFYRQRCSRR